MNVKVSVLLITYNHAPYVAQAIESVLAQQLSYPYEIVIGEDCSADATRQIVVDYHERYPDLIRLILPPRNLGEHGNRLFLEILAACRGDYVAFLDGDDYWSSSGKLQRQISFLDEHPECSMCFHNVSIVHEDDKSRAPYAFNPPEQKPFSTVEDLLPGNFVQTCSAMVRRVPFVDIPDWLQPIEPLDWALYLLAAAHGTIGYIDEVLAVYRRHGGAIWYGRGAAYYLERAIEFFDAMAPHLDSRYRPILEEQVSRRCYELSCVRETTGDWRGAAACLARSMEGRPAWMEAYVPGIGAKGPRIWRILERKVRLSRWPAAAGLLRRVEPWGRGMEWRIVRARASALRLMDKERPRIEGRLSATTSRVGSSGSGTAVVALSWTSTNADVLELHLGAPDGPTLTRRMDPSGSWTTGPWVTDGTGFFLQDVSHDRPLTLAHTLDAVRIRVTHD